MKRRIFLWMGLIVLFFLVGFYQEGYAHELYEVKHGDTLKKISKKFGVSQKEIRDINKLKRSSLKIHQTLLIPSKEKGEIEYGQAFLPKAKLYVVKRHDSLYTVSKKTGSSIDAIKEINHLRNNRLRVGQVLALSKSASAHNADKPSSSLDDKIEKSSTQPNNKFVSDETSVTAAKRDEWQDNTKQVNILSSRDVMENEPINPVNKGEIVPAENSVSAINTAQSNIPNNDANKTSKIQSPEMKSISKSSKKTSSITPPPLLRSYVVKKGDNIYKISRRFHLCVASLKKINHLRSSALKVGQVLVVSDSPAKNDKATPESIASVSTSDSVEEEVDNSNSGPFEGKYNEADMEREIQTTSEIIGTWNSPVERNLLVKVVMGFLGTPYKFGGSSIRGLDCSAFVRKIYGFFDINLPRTAREQSRVGKRISRSDLEIGDLVFFNTRRSIGHVGIYVGNNEFIHASYRGKEVRIDTLDTPYYDKRFIKAVRLKKLDEKGDAGIPY